MKKVNSSSAAKRGRVPDISEDTSSNDDFVFKKPFLPKRFKKSASRSYQPLFPTQNRAMNVNPEDFAQMLQNMGNQLSNSYLSSSYQLTKYRNNSPHDHYSDQAEPTYVHLTSGHDSDDEEEDVNSEGDPDEEVDAEVAKLTYRWEQNRLEEEERIKNIPGPSNLGPCPVVDDDFIKSLRASAKASPVPSPTNIDEFLAEKMELELKQAEERRLREEKEPVEQVQHFEQHQQKVKNVLERTLGNIQQNLKSPSNLPPLYFFIPENEVYIRNSFFHSLIYHRGNTTGTFITGAKFVLVEDRDGLLRKSGFKTFNRIVPRNRLTEPPLLQEFIEDYQHRTDKHPRASQYDPNYNYAMIEYAEDPFWSQRVVPIPRTMICAAFPMGNADLGIASPQTENGPQVKQENVGIAEHSKVNTEE